VQRGGEKKIEKRCLNWGGGLKTKGGSLRGKNGDYFKNSVGGESILNTSENEKVNKKGESDEKLERSLQEIRPG